MTHSVDEVEDSVLEEMSEEDVNSESQPTFWVDEVENVKEFLSNLLNSSSNINLDVNDKETMNELEDMASELILFFDV